MDAELPKTAILDGANEMLERLRLEHVTQRTFDYWVGEGLIQAAATRRGKGGRAFFPDQVRLDVVAIRELQTYYDFTLGDIQAALDKGSTLEDIRDFMWAAFDNGGDNFLSYARGYACSHQIEQEPEDEAIDLYIEYQVAGGDEELDEEQVAELLSMSLESVTTLCNHGELPHHGYRFLREEIVAWKRERSLASPEEMMNEITILIRICDALCKSGLMKYFSSHDISRLRSSIEDADDALWRVRRHLHGIEMSGEKMKSQALTGKVMW